MTTYRMFDQPADGTAGQDCGSFSLGDLPQRVQDAIAADPTAGEWDLPALTDGDTGDELDDLQTVIREDCET